MDRPPIDELTYSVIGAFFEGYNTLGFGFLEHVYTLALERELRARGHDVAREVSIPVFYKGDELTRQRLDMIVDHVLVVESKSTTKLDKSAPRQLYNYLKSTKLEAGLLFISDRNRASFRANFRNMQFKSKDL
ncbi:MAG TPA: GxxExxY protein [Gemmatimonadaceae bacterium]|nr:GxxExxY protein [Gemmatimonadaceae bacterium]